jgi:indolepyruvate ferredoxin oxidoreductase alpha subunit
VGRVQSPIKFIQTKIQLILMANSFLAGKGKAILLGTEAIARGALESGIGFTSTYPGTPASEIGDTFAAVAKEAGIYFEYSVNEKVALEAAAGAGMSGVRSMVSFKQFGLNVASDSFFPSVYAGTKAGFVIVVADDPNCWSSGQSEQDCRYYSRMGHIPMIEPSSPQECKEFTKFAFNLSEKFKMPVLIRLTTRVSHTKGIVKFEKIIKGKTKGNFDKNAYRLRNFPPYLLDVHKELHEKLEKFKAISEKTELNLIFNKEVKSEIGIITFGASFNYVIDSLSVLNLRLPVLKLGMTYPLPEKKIKDFLKSLKTVFVVEELEAVIEEEVKKLAKDSNPQIKIYGKNLLPVVGELNVEKVLAALAKITGEKNRIDLRKHFDLFNKLKVPARKPMLCPGCPHRATFYSAKAAASPDTVFGGDVGCYILGVFPPLDTQDFVFSMGASEGVIHGIRKVTDQKAIAFLGDSTFFHAGLPGLVNTIFNRSDPLVIVLDNRITAMTGHQPNPGMGKTGMGDETRAIPIEDAARGLGVRNVKVINPYNIKEMVGTIKEFLNKTETSVIVARAECRLLTIRRARKEGVKLPVFEIDPKKCKGCGNCLDRLGCPAITKGKGVCRIEKDLCSGCSVCFQICPNQAIHAVK